MSSEETVKTIAKALGEADDGPKAQIEAVVDALGNELCIALLAETERIEKAGGMERGDGKGRRSPGGVFFYLARQKLPKELRSAIFNDKMPRDPKPPGFEAPKKSSPERALPRRRVLEVNPSRPAAPAVSPGFRPSLGNGPSSSRGGWSPPPAPPGTHIPPQLPSAVSRGRAKLGVLDALGSLHPDDQYLVLLELLGDLYAVYGASAENAAPDSKSAPPESKSTLSGPASSPPPPPPPPVVVAAAVVRARAVVKEPEAAAEPPPAPKRKAPARKAAKN